MEVDRDYIEYMAQVIEEFIDTRTIKKGWDYYRQGRVLSHREKSPDIVEGRVRGNEDYNLLIYPEHFLDSDCSCPVEGPCKHVLATFFKLYESYGDPQNVYLSLLGVKPLAQRLNKDPKSEIALTATDSVEEWYKEFPKAFGPDTDDYNMLMNFHRARQTIVNNIKDWPENTKNLLLLNFYMFFLNSLQGGLQRAYLANYYKHDLSLIVRDFFYVAERMDFSRLNYSEKDLLSPVKELVRQNLIFSQENPVVSWLRIYRNLWGGNFRSIEQRDEEKIVIDRLSEQEKYPAHLYRINLARAHFSFLDGDFDKIKQLVDSPEFLTLSHVIDYLDAIERAGSWDHLTKWLLWLLPYIDKGTYYDKEKVFQYISSHIVHFDQEGQERLLGIMRKTLPRGIERFGWILISLGKYQDWVECHRLFHTEYFHFDKDQIKVIEKEAREALLPLYHQLVFSLIRKRRRDYYKLAVRYLKKLKAIYKKLKREEVWESYLNQLVSETRRLKAFNEELHKGKLIDHG